MSPPCKNDIYTPVLGVCSWVLMVTSQWARWRLKLSVSRWFAQAFVQAQIKEKSSASPAFVRGIHRWSVNSPQKGASNAENIFPFDDVIMWGIVLVHNLLAAVWKGGSEWCMFCWTQNKTGGTLYTNTYFLFSSTVIITFLGQLLNIVSGVDLSKKDLTGVPTDIPWSTTLFDLSHNKLVILHTDTFIQLFYLTRLDLNHNEKIIVQYGALRGLNKLIQLRLHRNNLSTMPDISGLSTLTYLVLSSNIRIHSINATMFGSMTQLNVLRLESIGASSVSNFPALSLRHLYLGRNRISSLEHQPFQTLTSLLRLTLEENELRNLPHLRGIEENVKYLNLSANRLYHFPDMSAYSSLEKLDFSNNFITSIPEGSLAPKQFVDVNLEGNPIVCVTELCWLVSKQWPFTVSVTCPGGTPLVNMGQDVICQGRWKYCRPWNNKQHTRIYSTHWGQVTHICVSRLTILGSDNGLSPDQRQAIM